jgi:two-component system response regulator FixJ
MSEAIVNIIDDDNGMRRSLAYLMASVDMPCRTWESAVRFLVEADLDAPGVIVTDVRMPQMTGLDLARQLKARGSKLPIIVMTGHGDIALAVEAMKAGAVEFLEKPFEEAILLEAIRTALATPRAQADGDPEKDRLRAIFEKLSPRENDVLKGVVEGKMNKVIAFELGISPRTVEVYRANMMQKTQARSLSELVKMVMLARN